MSEINTSQQNHIVCPHCGYEDCEEWDHDLNYDDANEIRCSECDRDFYVTVWNPIYYTSGKTIDEARDF